MQPQHLGLADEHTQDAATARQVTDRRPRLLIEAGRNEALERRSASVNYTECRVARPRQRRRRLDDPLQDRVERELGADRDPRLEQGAQPV